MTIDTSGMGLFTVKEVVERLERMRQTAAREDEARIEHSIRFLTGNEPV